MNITKSSNGKHLVISFGEARILDTCHVERVARELQEFLARTDDKTPILSFAGVSFISSALLTKLAKLNQTCDQRGITLTFRDVPPNILEVFRICNLDRLFHIQTAA